MQLSKNLSLNEVTKSNTAIRKGIVNMPNEIELNALKAIATEVFQPIRDHFSCPIYVSSGFRSVELNKAVNGSLSSSHCKGEALDIDMDNRNSVTNREIFEYIRKNLTFDQLLWEYGDDFNPSWVHVSYSKDDNRNQVLVVYKDNGVTKYKPFGR